MVLNTRKPNQGQKPNVLTKQWRSMLLVLLASPLITKLQSGSVHIAVTADACLLVIARISDNRVP